MEDCEVTKFQKLPVVIDAILYTGENLAAVFEFTGKHPKWDQWFFSFGDYEAFVKADRGVFKIYTLEGTMEANPGDWIIRGVKGEHYPCKPDIFAATYVPATAPISGMSFGDALVALKAGAKVARRGWNGKGMWLAYVSSGAYDVGVKTMIGADDLLPWIGMKTADNGFVPWLASQTDMLAEDWGVVL